MTPEEETTLAALLSQAETEGLSRFGRPELRRRALVARAALRAILSGYAGQPAPTLSFIHGLYGKPRLDDDVSASVAFNVSHSHERAVVAITKSVEVGVDVEHLRPLRQIEALAERYLATEERETLLARPEAEWSEGFVRLWVCKEAVVKAMGLGLQFRPDRFEVRWETKGSDAKGGAAKGSESKAGEPDAGKQAQPPTGTLSATPRLVSFDGDSEAAAGWTLAPIPDPSGYAGAVAAPRRGMKIHTFVFDAPSATDAR